MRVICGKPGYYVVLTAVAALLLSSTTLFLAHTEEARAAPVISGTCNPAQVKYKVSATVQSTSSTAYVDVNDSAMQVRLREVGCIIIKFSAEAFAHSNDTIRVRVLPSGMDFTACQPSDHFFISSNRIIEGYSSQAMNYVCHNIPAGTRLIKLQFRSGSGAGVQLRNRTVLMWY